eukprot:TRINITY_DN2613_c0_g1_i3.p1 TRINITY_DN2613_c0_g1~~TRINITY_DN2613_c0_g1_i3.p1  ORF type:complete len:289 (-),score=40.51 TRINITY_DN2613_c0_g1_i3:152-1018(-)
MSMEGEQDLNKVYQSCSWMEHVPDSTLLSALSIPGTHQTMATTVGRWGIIHNKCQTRKLAEQLEDGMRFFDIRLKYDVKLSDFTLHHAAFYMGSKFSEVQRICEAFLRAHPSEVILMRVRQEYKQHLSFANELLSLVRQKPELYAHGASVSSPIKDLRGKVLLLQNFDAPEIVSGDYNLLRIQDNYEINYNHQIQRKWKDIRDHFELAKSGEFEHAYLNFTSGSGYFCTPSLIAWTINRRLNAWLRQHDGTHDRIGIIAMDFYWKESVDLVIWRNRTVPRPLSSPALA